MLKKFALGGIGLLFLASPLLASAQATASIQAQIDALLKQITQLQAQITALRGQSTTSTASTSLCLDLNNALIVGSTDATTNGEVSKLQRFLGAYKVNKLYTMAPDNQSGASAGDLQPVTGYYGSKTAANVMEWQKAHGMDFVTIRSGVGKMTRAKFREMCSPTNQTVSVNISVSGLNGPTITLLDGVTVLGQKYIRVRNMTDAIDIGLGLSLRGNGLGDSCVDTVRASLEIANPKVDTDYQTMWGDPVVGVDVVRVISHDSPVRNCAT